MRGTTHGESGRAVEHVQARLRPAISLSRGVRRLARSPCAFGLGSGAPGKAAGLNPATIGRLEASGGTTPIVTLNLQAILKVFSAHGVEFIEGGARKPTENLNSYDYFLRGMASLHQWKKDDVQEALQLFYRAIELDPKFASAYGAAAQC